MIRALFAATLLLSTAASAAEIDTPALSPRARVMQTVGLVEITVDYSSPGKRDRTIWGDLVPYGEKWRTGANSATTFETSGDVKVGGQEVPAGKYGVLTIPGESEWTVILNSNAGVRAGSHDEALDVAKFTVTPVEGPPRERLTFVFSDHDESGANLDLEWDGVRVRMPIEVDTAATVNAAIDGFAGAVGSELAGAARYLAGQGEKDRALELLDQSIAMNETWYNTWLKAEILHDKGMNKDARKLAEAALAMGNEAGGGFFWKDRVEEAVAEWPKK